MDFNSVWRKRQACVRCRQLKVRCEYASPTETTCVRCERSHTPCITTEGKKKNGTSSAAKDQARYGESPEDDHAHSVPEDHAFDEAHAKEEHAVYLQHIIRDAQTKLRAIGISPLRRAIAAKLLTVEEAEGFYTRFRSSPNMFPVLILLRMPPAIVDLDEKWPLLSMAIVCVVALNSASKPQKEIQLYIDEIFRNDADSPSGFDQHLALAVVCQFSLWHNERGISMLLQFYASSVTLMRKLRAMSEFAKERLVLHIAAITILPYMLVNNFAPLSQLSYFFSDVVHNVCDSYDIAQHEDGSGNVNGSGAAAGGASDIMACPLAEDFSPHIIASGPLMEVLICYQRALSDIAVATTVDDLKRVVETALTSIQLLENHMALIQIGFAKAHRDPESYAGVPECENLSLTPLRPCYLIAKMRLVRAAANRSIDVRSCSGELHLLLRTAIEQAAASGGQLFRSFAHVDSRFPLVPTVVYYYVADALRIMQMMRFMAFAGSVEVDVRSDCLLQVVTVKWEDFVRVSTIARNSFMLLFLPLDTSNVKIGILDKTNAVVGPGNMQDFEVYNVNGVTHTVQETTKVTREDLLQLIDSVLQRGDWSPQGAPQSETAAAISFPTALKLLLTDVDRR